MSAVTLTVRGKKLRSASRRRFLVVRVTYERERFEAPVVTGVSTYKRSDSLGVARTHARRASGYPGEYFVIVDSLTGEEISG